VIQRVSELLARCGSDAAVLPPTALYSEGWLLGLVLDRFDRKRDFAHELSFLPEARWYSEALIAPPFLAEWRGDHRAETFTHADGLIGHFAIRPGERGEAKLLPNARQATLVEATLGSGLSPGVKNASTYDQAARNVACLAHMLAEAQLSPKSMERLGFYVLAPQRQIQAGVFGDSVGKLSIHSKVEARVAQYGGSRDAWFRDAFEPLLEHVEMGLLSWESILDLIEPPGPPGEIRVFYHQCLRFNPQRAEPGPTRGGSTILSVPLE